MSSEIVTHCYEAEVLEVLSGDDLVLLVNLGIDGLYKRTRARLFKVDTPDAFKADPNSEAGRVRGTVKSMVSGKHCFIEVHSERKTGWIVTLYIGRRDKREEATCVNTYLLSLGYVYKSGQVNDE